MTQINPGHVVVRITEGDPSVMIGMTARIELSGAAIEKPASEGTTGKSKATAGTITGKTTAAEKVEPQSPLPYRLDKQTGFAWTVLGGGFFLEGIPIGTMPKTTAASKSVVN